MKSATRQVVQIESETERLVPLSDSSPTKSEEQTVSKQNYESSASPFIRLFFLLSLCLQNAFYTLLRRYSKRTSQVSDSSILIVAEMIKLTVSFAMCFVGRDYHGTLRSHISNLISRSPKMLVPAVVYYLMNRLSFFALSRIDAGTFTVCAQLKTLSTAAFSYLLLGRKFSQVRVRSLIHLVCGVIVIAHFAATHQKTIPATGAQGTSWEFLLGVGAVSLEVILSGSISVYYEKVLKDDKRDFTVWDRNMQLASFSVLLYSPTFYASGMMIGWDVVTMLVAVLGAGGGLLVAFSMKYTDAILKALATSGAIVLSSSLGAYFLNGPFGVPVAVASISVVVSILTYVTDGKFPQY